MTTPDADAETASLIWMHTLAIGHAPAYLIENADGIRQDWLRVPLPDNLEALRASAQLGAQIAALLDMDAGVDGITHGTLCPELRQLARIAHADGGSLRPEAGDLTLTAGWGHGGRNGIVMPGRGKSVERDYTEEELGVIEARAMALGIPLHDILAHLGARTYDVQLNAVAFWRNVPTRVWDYTIGGYQVIKKWLRYREYEVLGRSLTVDEAREVTQMVRRIGALLLLEPVDLRHNKRSEGRFSLSGKEKRRQIRSMPFSPFLTLDLAYCDACLVLNANYEQVSTSCYSWPDGTLVTAPDKLATTTAEVAQGVRDARRNNPPRGYTAVRARVTRTGRADGTDRRA